MSADRPVAAGRDTVDAVVVGTGQAGPPLAKALGTAGYAVAVVEREHVGGSCVNYGCTPTKTLVASAHVAHLAHHAERWGVRVEGVRVDVAAVRERTRRVVESFRDGARRGLETAAGIELIFGHGRLTGPRTVDVELAAGGRRTLSARRWIFLDTGTRPRPPAIEGLDTVPTLDNRTVMELAEAPRRLLVLGGGYIGCELSQVYRRFGSEVTLIQRGERLLGTEDDDVAEAIAGVLREDGIEVLLGARTHRAACSGGGDDRRISLDIECDGRTRTLIGSHLLVATGRTPNSDDLGLDAAGVATDPRGYVTVNDRLETSAGGIYALGDLNGGPAFTHVAYDDFRVVKANLLDGDGAERAGEADGDAPYGRGGSAASRRGRLVPYVLFLDPQLGRVGLTERQAREQGRDVRVARLEMKDVARAVETGDTRGFLKAVVDDASGEILGCAMLGREAGELMAVVQVAMLAGLPYPRLRDTIFAHPTLAESLNNLFARLD